MALSAGASYFGPFLGLSTLSGVLTRFCANGFGLACILFSFLPTADAHQSRNEKLIKADDPVQITDAVMITNIAVAGKTVDCGLFIKPSAVVQPVTPFQADTNWLQQMTIPFSTARTR